MTEQLDLTEHSHRRLNQLTGEGVIVSPHRTKRSWQGQTESPTLQTLATYDPDCYLCPGNERAGGHRNPRYLSVFVFDNDFDALTDTENNRPGKRRPNGHASRTRDLPGRVLLTRPQLTLTRMDASAIRLVVDEWERQYEDLGKRSYIHHVQIFENRGAMMGASNPHRHCQVWATESIPNEPAKELVRQSAHHSRKGSCLLCDYLRVELPKGERVVVDNEHFVALVPFWAIYPFEILILGKRHVGAISDLNDGERSSLADILRLLTIRYDNLFRTPFPYSMGFHQASHATVHFHAHFYPPLLLSATIRKFLVGFELLGSPQRDLTPEQAAARLRELSDVHYAA